MLHFDYETVLLVRIENKHDSRPYGPVLYKKKNQSAVIMVSVFFQAFIVIPGGVRGEQVALRSGSGGPG